MKHVTKGETNNDAKIPKGQYVLKIFKVIGAVKSWAPVEAEKEFEIILGHQLK